MERAGSRTARLLSPDAEGIGRAAEILRGGGLVAFPTETVYGLGARADDARAARRIFEAKGRPPTNPLIVHVPDAARARALAAAWPDAAEALAAALWPGPLTLVVRGRPGATAAEVRASGETLGVRVPSHPVARALLGAAGVPVAAPSANRSESLSPTRPEHVLASLGTRIEAVLDGGACAVGIESTIVDVSGPRPRLLRPGGLDPARLRDVLRALGPEALEGLGGPGALESPLVIPAGERAPSPGTSARHYAPRAELVIAPAGSPALALALASASRPGLLATAPPPSTPVAAARLAILPSDPAGYAAELYAALHDLDGAGCDRIVVVEPPRGEAWAAIRDRLLRASAPPGP